MTISKELLVRPTMRFVSVKSQETQGATMVLSVRIGLKR